MWPIKLRGGETIKKGVGLGTYLVNPEQSKYSRCYCRSETVFHPIFYPLRMRKSLFLLLLTVGCSIRLAAQTQPPDPLPEQYAVFSVWSQRLDLSQYVGKKYRLSAAIRVEPATPESFAAIFIRNEPPQGGLRAWTYMDNMRDRPVKDTAWQTYTLEYVVDPKAPWIGFGTLAFGNGVFFYDMFQLSVETAKDEWTPIPIDNSDFEQPALAPWLQTSQGVPARVLGAAATLFPEKAFSGQQCLRVENNFLFKD